VARSFLLPPVMALVGGRSKLLATAIFWYTIPGFVVVGVLSNN